MRRTIWIATLLLLAGCSEFLDEDPRSLATPDVFFTEASSAQSSVDALYSLLGGDGVYASEMWLLNALFSDNGKANVADPVTQELAAFEVQSDNPVVEAIWRKLYEAVNAANFAIAGIPTSPVSQAEQKELLAEARFFRGLFYFELARCFGGVPLQTDPVLGVDQVVRSERVPIDSVMALVISDFTFAQEGLPEQSSSGRPSSFVATAFLAKALAETGNTRSAFQLTRAVILSNRFSLLDDYASLFTVGNKVNTEVMLASPLSSQSPGDINIRCLPPQLRGRSLEVPTDLLARAFPEGDTRGPATVIESVMAPDSSVTQIAPHIAKYWDERGEPSGGPTAVNYPILRYADILLLHAELVNELNNGPTSEAYFVANLVRQRAGLAPLSGLNKDTFRKALLDERQRELAWEGYRWYDLKRFVVLEEYVTLAKPGVTVESKHYLLPIPRQEIALNPQLEQNPGY